MISIPVTVMHTHSSFNDEVASAVEPFATEKMIDTIDCLGVAGENLHKKVLDPMLRLLD